MLKKRSKVISVLVALAFLFTMIMPGVAFAADPAKITNTTRQGVDENNSLAQSLGFVKITDIDDCEEVWVTMELPSDVDFVTAPTDITKAVYVENFDSLNAAQGDVVWNSGDGDEYTVKFPGADVSAEGDYIKLWFCDDSAGVTADPDKDAAVIVKKGAPSDIKATVTVKGVEDGLQVWEYSEECLIGVQGDAEVTMEVADAKSVTSGSGQLVAKITIEENIAGALEATDNFVFSLPDDVEWDALDADDANYNLKEGKYGLEIDLTINADGDLVATVADTTAVPDGNCTSTIFADKFSFEGLVTVFPNAGDGDVEVDVECDLNTADSDDCSLVAAYVGDTAATVDVEDTADDTIYQADFNKEVDEITLEASGSFTDGDKVTMTLNDGVVWYMDKADFDAIDEITCLGLYDDNQSVWLEMDTPDDEVTLDGLKVATLPDAEAGDIVVTFDGDYEGEAIIGEVLPIAEITADVPVVSLASLGVEAGDITLIETKKGSLADTEVISLSLPSGVDFSKLPTVEVNGDELASAKVDWAANDVDVEITLDKMKSNKVDTIVITDIEYDLDTRVRGDNVEVEIFGTAVNLLNGAVVAGKVPTDFKADYSDDTVLTVVNATAQDAASADSVFTIGATTYTVNGVEYTLDAAPYISGSRTYLPVRFVAYALGISDSNILWNQDLQTVTLMKGDKVVQLQVGSTNLLINGATVTMDTAPEITADRVCLPIRFVAQAFSAVVGWDAATQQVTVEL